MVRLFIFSAAVALILLILALISGLSADRVRNLPRALWVLVIIFVPIAGPIGYFLWGRPVRRAAGRAPSRPSSPDDDPEFLRSMNIEQSRRDRETLAQWERDLHTERDLHPEQGLQPEQDQHPERDLHPEHDLHKDDEQKP